MIFYKLFLLLIFVILIGCSQPDSNSDAPSDDNSGTKQSESSLNGNTSADEAQTERIGKVLAVVNGQPIYDDEYTREDLDYFITEEILYQEGIKKGYDKSIKDKAGNFERNLLIATLKQSILENAEPAKEISSEDIKNYYESNKDKYRYVTIQEISFPESSLGSEIIGKAGSGEELQAIANGYPDIPITVKPISYNKAMAEHFTSLEAGSVSEVIRKPDGKYSVLKIQAVKEIPLKTATHSIKNVLEAKRKAQLYNNYAQKVAEENNMTIEIIEQDSKQ